MKDLKTFLENEGCYFDLKEIKGRGFCGLEIMIFTTRLWYGLTYEGREGGYDYKSLNEAKAALNLWDGISDPPGNWIKHKGGKGEYLNPNLQKTKSN